MEALNYLENYLTQKVGIFIEIDTGYHRSGIPWKDLDMLETMMDFIATGKWLDFKGLFTHSGHTYHVENPEEILEIYKDTVLKMNYIKDRYIDIWPEMIVSVGDTPASSLVSSFEEVDEIRPGNFVFYDLMQYSIGACSIEQVAVALACPVIAKNPERNEIVIYGGAVHLSKDFLYRSNGERIFGYIVKLSEESWSRPLKGTFLVNLTQDHGVIRTTVDVYDNIKHGDLIGVLPVHSCLTANLMKKYLTLDGETISY
jgi:D-serine deaminase-like pyridoxal phosphate-dependent protein